MYTIFFQLKASLNEWALGIYSSFCKSMQKGERLRVSKHTTAIYVWNIKEPILALWI